MQFNFLTEEKFLFYVLYFFAAVFDEVYAPSLILNSGANYNMQREKLLKKQLCYNISIFLFHKQEKIANSLANNFPPFNIVSTDHISFWQRKFINVKTHSLICMKKGV